MGEFVSFHTPYPQVYIEIPGVEQNLPVAASSGTCTALGYLIGLPFGPILPGIPSGSIGALGFK
jgi:hypothetical protein